MAIDVVTQSLLNDFSKSQNIDNLPESEQFEAFTNYIVVSDVYHEEFDFNVVSTGNGEFGIDGIAIIVNDILVDDEEQAEDMVAHNSTLQVQFIFLQSKTSSSFNSGNMSKFYQAVLDFFSNAPKFQQNEKISELRKIKNRDYPLDAGMRT